MARLVWTDRGARIQTGSRLTWVDGGAHIESFVAPSTTAWGFDEQPAPPMRRKFYLAAAEVEVPWLSTATVTPSQFGFQADPQFPVRRRIVPHASEQDVVIIPAAGPVAITRVVRATIARVGAIIRGSW